MNSPRPANSLTNTIQPAFSGPSGSSDSTGVGRNQGVFGSLLAQAERAAGLSITRVAPELPNAPGKGARAVRSVEAFVRRLAVYFTTPTETAPHRAKNKVFVQRKVAAVPGQSDPQAYLESVQRAATRLRETALTSDREAFAVLHESGRYVFSELMGRAPGKGSSIAGASLYLAAGIPQELRISVDSVFQSSFADAYAVYCRNEDCGTASALSMGQDALRIRISNGDITNYSVSPISADTRAALLDAMDKVRSGTVRSDPAVEALDSAAHGVGAWLSKHGVPAGRAAALSDLVKSVAQGFAGNRLAPENTLRPSASPIPVDLSRLSSPSDSASLPAPAPVRPRP